LATDHGQDTDRDDQVDHDPHIPHDFDQEQGRQLK